MTPTNSIQNGFPFSVRNFLMWLPTFRHRIPTLLTDSLHRPWRSSTRQTVCRSSPFPLRDDIIRPEQFIWLTLLVSSCVSIKWITTLMKLIIGKCPIFGLWQEELVCNHVSTSGRVPRNWITRKTTGREIDHLGHGSGEENLTFG